MAGSSFNPRPKSINEVADYILKKLGAPLLEINVTEEQILDRITDAIVYFQEHHQDGTYEGFFKTQIEATALVLQQSVENKAEVDEVVSGTGFSACIHSISDDFLTVYLVDVVGDLEASDVVTIGGRAEEFTVTSLTKGPADTGWLTIPDNVESILQVLKLPREADNKGTLNFFSANSYRNTTYTSNFFNYRGGSLGTSFYLQQIREETLDWLTRLDSWVDFNRYLNKAFLNAFDYKANIGNYIVFKVLVSVDPEEFPEMYSDIWFLNYATELVRLQWGENLSKYDNVTLLNGVTVNGQKIADQAKERIRELHEEMESKYMAQLDFFIA